MHKFIAKTIKATIINVIVAFFITIAILMAVHLSFGARIEEVFSYINKVSIDIENKKIEPTTINAEKEIKNYPEYGTKYATIEIPKINVNLPVYFGDTLEILKNGVGHSSRKLFSRRRRFYCIHGT